MERMIQFNVRNSAFLWILVTFIYGAIDDLYQKIAHFSNQNYFLFIRSVRLSTVYFYLGSLSFFSQCQLVDLYFSFSLTITQSQLLGQLQLVPQWVLTAPLSPLAMEHVFTEVVQFSLSLSQCQWVLTAPLSPLAMEHVSTEVVQLSLFLSQCQWVLTAPLSPLAMEHVFTEVSSLAQLVPQSVPVGLYCPLPSPSLRLVYTMWCLVYLQRWLSFSLSWSQSVPVGPHCPPLPPLS